MTSATENCSAGRSGNSATVKYLYSVTERDTGPADLPAVTLVSEALTSSDHIHPIFWLRAPAEIMTVQAEPGTSARAIASEIVVRAAHFSATGEGASIDLRFLKSMPAEREALSFLLGNGEVSAVVQTMGHTQIRETSISCVWWISHRNPEGETVGELIEITAIPDLLVGDRESIIHGLETLRSALLPGVCE